MRKKRKLFDELGLTLWLMSMRANERFGRMP
jgi:hypothetical protein